MRQYHDIKVGRVVRCACDAAKRIWLCVEVHEFVIVGDKHSTQYYHFVGKDPKSVDFWEARLCDLPLAWKECARHIFVLRPH